MKKKKPVPHKNTDGMLSETLKALKLVSFYSSINHASSKDYGDIVNPVLKKLGIPTGTM